MNEKDFKHLRKHLKNSDTSMISMKEVVSIYLKPEQEEPLFVKNSYYEMLEEDDKDFLMKNFRKILTGGLNRRIFELRFEEEVENSTQDVLEDLLSTQGLNNFAVVTNSIVEKVINNYMYDSDIILHIARFELGTEDSTLTFVAGTTNKVELPKAQYTLNYQGGSEDNDITTKYSTDPVVNMTSPIDGFLYPTLEDGGTNVSKIINYHRKVNETNSRFITEVLNAELVLTEKEERDYFNLILKQLLGDKVRPQLLHELYSVIYYSYETEEDSEHRVLHKSQLVQILESQGIELQRDIQEVYEEVIGVQNYGFRVDSIVPDFNKKSFKINNDEADIHINPRDLDKVRQVKSENGQMYLMVEINRDSEVEGISLDSDEIPTINFNNE